MLLLRHWIGSPGSVSVLPAKRARNALSSRGDVRVNHRSVGYDLAFEREGYSGYFSLSLAKAVADMALRQDVFGTSRIVLNFLSKLVDKNAQIFAFVTVLRSPNGD